MHVQFLGQLRVQPRSLHGCLVLSPSFVRNSVATWPGWRLHGLLQLQGDERGAQSAVLGCRSPFAEGHVA